jgi:copper chaperone CopZ
MKKIILMCLVALLGVGAANAQKPKSGEKKSVTVEFMTSLDCEGCAKKINETLPYEKGVRDVKIDVPTKVVTVTYDPSKTNNEAIIKAFAKVKIKASVKEGCAGGCDHKHEAEKRECTDDCCKGHKH